MTYIITEGSTIEESAIEQFIDAMDQPFSVKGALMPDAHLGYSLPIGAVIATKGMILPAWVGYDIGCGMCALMLEGIDKNEVIKRASDIFDGVYGAVPVGFKVNPEATPYSLQGLTGDGAAIAIKKRHEHAIGSLGGGNHFIEIGYDDNDQVWIVIHSGSRGVGHGIASHYIRKAHPENKCKDGHFGFHPGSRAGRGYIQDLEWALRYALANRQEMMGRVISVITEALELSCYELDFSGLINKNHNHAVEKGGLWIHRKGATQAEDGELGVIPGNMRDGSFVVKGKGNPDSLCSSSHGAGRVLGRKEAKRKLNMADFKTTMVGISALVEESTLDESPKAYKNIFEVMEQQSHFVEVIAHIKPLINIKG